MKLFALTLIVLSASCLAASEKTVLEPGYGYQTDSLSEESKNSQIQDSDLTSQKKSVKSDSVELPTSDAPATPEPAQTHSEAPAQKPAPTEKDFYKMECTHATLFHAGIPAEKMCDVVTHICSGDFMNYYSMFYCSLGGSWVGFFVIMIIVIFLIFKYTAIVVDEYIVPGLEKSSQTLGFSESLSAVTLMALANGAGDVITALVSGSGSGGVSYNIGALYGAGLFVAVCVVSLCVFISTSEAREKQAKKANEKKGTDEENKNLNAQNVVVAPKAGSQEAKDLAGVGFDPMIIYRDIGFYLLSTVVTILFALVGWVYWWMPVIFLLIYVGYVAFVVVWERTHPEGGENKDGNELTAGQNDGGQPNHQEGSGMAFLTKVGAGLAKKHNHALMDFIYTKKALKIWEENKKNAPPAEDGEESEAKDESCLGQFMEWIDTPYVFACKLTALPSHVNQEEWAAWKFYCYPVTGMFWGHWVFTGEWISMSLLTIALPICVVLYVVFYFGLKNGIPKAVMTPSEQATADCTVSHSTVLLNDLKKAEKLSEIVEKLKEYNTQKCHGAGKAGMTWFQWFVVILGVIAGLMWTYVLVGFLIDLLNCFGVLLGLDNTFLGLTILAVGNALPDALTTISLVKKGQGTMAIAGGYAGQLFGLLVGFGLAQLKTTLISGPQKFDLFNPAAINENILDLIVLGTAFICLLLTFLWGIFNKYQMTKPFAYISFAIYGVFLVVCSILAISKAVANF